MATASEEFFVRFRYWLASGGMMIRMACGIITSRVVRLGRRPSALGSFRLAVAHRQNAGAHDFGDEGCGVNAEANQQRYELRLDVYAAPKLNPPRYGIIKRHRPPGKQQGRKRRAK